MAKQKKTLTVKQVAQKIVQKGGDFEEMCLKLTYLMLLCPPSCDVVTTESESQPKDN